MNEDAAKPDLDHLSWAVERRAEIQHTLLAMYKYVRGNKPSHLFLTIVLDHCIAAAFSLWRAVFLADKVRTTEDTHNAQEKFLETVVTTNAINFPDDRRNSAWTVGFYLENARRRMAEAADLAHDHFNLVNRDEIKTVLGFRLKDDSHLTRYEWECAHFALRCVFNAIAPHILRLPIIQPKSPTTSKLFTMYQQALNDKE